MLVNLSPKRHFRSEIEIHRKNLRRDWDLTRDEANEITFDFLFQPTEYTGVYFSNGNESVINEWCKQHAVYAKLFKVLQKMKANGATIDEIVAAEHNAWSYGVADNIEQVLDYYNTRDYFKGNHVVLVKWIRKNHNSGWRWHKWGEYIGIQNPQCEYLDDEPEIEKVLIFSIYKVI